MDANMQTLKKYMNWHPTPGAVNDFPAEVPDDYREVIEAIGPGEGFIGTQFVRLFRPSELEQLNEAYDIGGLVPGLFLIGSDGGGEAYCYDRRGDSFAVVRVPFIPLSLEFAEVIGVKLSAVLEAFTQLESDGEGPFPLIPNPDTEGMEITERHPIVFGGSPTDPDNKLVVDRTTHIKLVRFWNAKYREVERREAGGH